MVGRGQGSYMSYVCSTGLENSFVQNGMMSSLRNMGPLGKRLDKNFFFFLDLRENNQLSNDSRESKDTTKSFSIDIYIAQLILNFLMGHSGIQNSFSVTKIS